MEHTIWRGCIQSSRAWTYIQSTGGTYDQDWAQGGDKYLKTESKRKRKVIKPDGSVARPPSKTKAQPSRSYVPQDDGQDDGRRTAHFPAARENISAIRPGLGDKVKRGIHCQEGDTLSRGGYAVKRGIHCQEGGYTKRRKHCREEEVTKRKYLPRRGMFEEEGHTQEARNVGHTAKQRDSRHDEHPTQAIPARPSKRWNRSMIKYLSINSGTHPPALCREREQSEGHAASHDEDSMTSYRDPEMSRDR